MTIRTHTAAALASILVLGACSQSDTQGAPDGERDPAAEQALNDPLMTDPDLAGQNEGNAALSAGTDRSLPPENTTPEAIASARSEAAALVGGADALKPAPRAKKVEGDIPESAALTSAARAAITPGGANCAEQVRYSASWAAKLPAAFPVYPRGSTQEAAGTDRGECALRVVNFLTAVPLDDVLAFYHTRAKASGYSAEHIVKDGDNILSGTKGDAAFVVYGRRLRNKLTEIDLVTTGG